MFECEITVKGGGNSPSRDGPVTGPVKDFFRNYSKCYTAVKNHVVKCPDCCPEEALRRFLATRDKPSLGGFTSGGLLSMALQVERGCRDAPGKEPPTAMVDTFLIRSGRPVDLIRHGGRLTPAGKAEALRWIWRQWEELARKHSWRGDRKVLSHFFDPGDAYGRDGLTTYWLVRMVGETFEAGLPFPPLEGLERLATVAEVMYG